jgi:putative ABC transport system ATP-binding protein
MRNEKDAMDEQALMVRNLAFRRAEGFVLHAPDVTLRYGESLALVGPSGSGKTTLLQLCAGILTAQPGSVIALGRDLALMSAAERRRLRLSRIGQARQDFDLIDYLSAFDNILYPFRLGHGLRLDAAARARAEALAHRAGLAHRLAMKSGKLSQGEKQRVALCRALATQPALILADEPTGNLDADNRDRTLDLLFEESRRLGASLVVATHERDSLARFDQILDLGSPARREG